jgi:hypothetical protein
MVGDLERPRTVGQASLTRSLPTRRILSIVGTAYTGGTIMAEPFIFINTYAIKPGKADAYKEKFREAAGIVEAKEPRMLYFAHHESEDGSEGTTVQVHSDPDNMALHMQLIGDHIRQAAEDLDFSSMDIRIYGSPSEAVLDQMRQIAGSGVSVTVSPATVGFNRFPQT